MKIKSFFLGKIFFLLVISLILTRSIFIKDFFHFGVDEEYQALLGWSIVKNFHILWIGVSASSTGYYLGPGLVYLSAFLLWLNRDPIIFGYFASFIGVITALSLFYIIKQLYNRQLALISFILYIFSPFAFYYDRKYWPLAIPLVALWLFFSLLKSLKNPLWLLLTSLLMGITYHLHISLWIFWPFVLFCFIYLIIKKLLPIYIVFGSILIFIISTINLLVFDFIHNFDNLLMPLRLITQTSKTQFSPNLLMKLDSFGNSLTKIWLPSSFINNYVGFIFLAIFVLFSVCFLIKNHDAKSRLLIGLIFSFFLGFTFFPSPMQEYYFIFIMPFVLILTAILINKMERLGYFFLLIFLTINIFSFIKQPVRSDYQSKLIVVKEIGNYVKKVPFSLEIDGSYLFNGGWRYLFQAKNLTPDSSSADAMFGWIYPGEISNQKPKYKVVISKNNNLQLNNSLIKKISSGDYFIYVVNF